MGQARANPGHVLSPYFLCSLSHNPLTTRTPRSLQFSLFPARSLTHTSFLLHCNLKGINPLAPSKLFSLQAKSILTKCKMNIQVTPVSFSLKENSVSDKAQNYIMIAFGLFTMPITWPTLNSWEKCILLLSFFVSIVDTKFTLIVSN